MKLISVDKLKGDEVLARPVLTKNYSELLAAGTKLKPEYINKLIELDIKDRVKQSNKELGVAKTVEDKPKQKTKDIK